MPSSRADELQQWIIRLKAGDSSARAELIRAASDRLMILARKMLRDFPGVRRWEDTDDVFQNSAIRIHQAIEKGVFEDANDFFRFASVIIRRELIDLSRHYQGPQGLGTHHPPNNAKNDSLTSDRCNPANDTHNPERLSLWTEFHRFVEKMEEEDRILVELLWYQELTQEEAATMLGVSERTVQRRWQQVRLKLHEVLRDPL